MKKILSYSLLWICFTLLTQSRGFAANYPGDCDLVVGQYTPENTFPLVNTLRTTNKAAPTNHEQIIDSASLNVALLNLKANCCAQTNTEEFWAINKTSCKTDEALLIDRNYPKSYYLYDHLLDVLMRRLDGFGSETNRYTQIGNGAKLDDKGQERRTKISEIMEKEEGTTPPVIKTLYNKYQTLDSKNHLNGFEQDTSQSSKYYVDQMLTGENKTKLENYANRSLADRYRNVCNLAGFLYALFRNDSNIKAIIDTNQMLLAGNRCTTLIQTRINAETTYIETVAIQKSTQALTDTVKEFANTYLNKRLADLQTLIQQSKTSRARVVKAVPKLIPICS